MPPSVHIEACGLTAAAIGLLLQRSGWHVATSPPTGRPPDAVTLCSRSAAMYRELLPDGEVRLGRRLRGRMVAWGHPPRAVEEPQRVVRRANLVPACSPSANMPGGEAAEPAWHIRGVDAASTRVHSAGRRQAWQCAVELRSEEYEDWLLVEATASGWLALTPVGARRGVLTGVSSMSDGRPIAAMLEESGLLKGVVGEAVGQEEALSIGPSLCLAADFAGQGLLAGGAVMAFDPLLGGGVRMALRHAAVCTGAIRAIHAGAPPAAVEQRYRATLTEWMSSHVVSLLTYIEVGPFRDAWTEDIGRLRLLQHAIEGGRS